MVVREDALRLAGAALGLAMLAGCNGGPGAGRAAGGGASPASTVQVKGSDTMLVLAQKWAAGFAKAHPDLRVNVTGGGSGTGMKALLNKTTAIANSSREIEPGEKSEAATRGLDVRATVVARDALTVIVNPTNPVNELTMAQLKDIFTGKARNWKAFGGPDQEIIVNCRETSSGSYKFFQEHVLGKGIPYAATALNQPATAQIVDNVGADKGGIGYVGLGYLNAHVKALKVRRDAASPAVEASAASVLNNTYPLARPLYEYTVGAPTGSVKLWLDWVTGPEGQKIVSELDFVPAGK